MKKKSLVLVIVIAAFLLALPAAGTLYSRLAAREEAVVGPAETGEPAGSPSPTAETASDGTAEEPAEERQAVPDFTVTAMDGSSVSLSDFAGKPRVVNFWATWCPPCRGELPTFESAWEQFGDRVEFLMVALVDGSRETEDTVRAFLEETGYRFPVYMDTEGSAAGDYGIYSIPMTVLVDSRGGLFGGQIGAMDEAALTAALEALAAEG